MNNSAHRDCNAVSRVTLRDTQAAWPPPWLAELAPEIEAISTVTAPPSSSTPQPVKASIERITPAVNESTVGFIELLRANGTIAIRPAGYKPAPYEFLNWRPQGELPWRYVRLNRSEALSSLL